MSSGGRSETGERRLAAILSADAVGYSRLLADDEAATIRTLDAYRREMGERVRGHRGRVVDMVGDNLLAEFPSAIDAAECAVAMQGALAARNAELPEPRQLHFRIGLHLGDVTVQGERIYGDGVNIASRLERLAPPGGICLSGTVHEQVARKLAAPIEDLGPRHLKNIPHPVHAYGIRPEPGAGAPVASAAASKAEELAGLGTRSDVAVFVVPAVWVLYIAIGFEILFMISPFAFYYYSAYGPSLGFLTQSPWTAWLTDFFLPHFSRTSNPLLNALPALGFVLITTGAAIFLVGFYQIYRSKLLQKGVVSGGIYAFTRHPQYLGLAVVGLGALLIWPRVLVLLSYVTMLFVYWALARSEERRCLQEFGESYRDYQERIGLVRRLHLRLSELLPASGPGRALALIGLYVVAVVASVGIAYRLRDYSLSTVSSHYEEGMAVLSPAPLSPAELADAVELARGAPEVRERLPHAGSGAKLLVYVLPESWQLADLPIALPEERPGGHVTPAHFERGVYKVLFTKVRTHDPGVTGRAIVEKAYGRDPVAVAHVDTGAGRVESVEEPPPHVIWGDISTPLF